MFEYRLRAAFLLPSSCVALYLVVCSYQVCLNPLQ